MVRYHNHFVPHFSQGCHGDISYQYVSMDKMASIVLITMHAWFVFFETKCRRCTHYCSHIGQNALLLLLITWHLTNQTHQKWCRSSLPCMYIAYALIVSSVTVATKRFSWIYLQMGRKCSKKGRLYKRRKEQNDLEPTNHSWHENHRCALIKVF